MLLSSAEKWSQHRWESVEKTALGGTDPGSLYAPILYFRRMGETKKRGKLRVCAEVSANDPYLDKSIVKDGETPVRYVYCDGMGFDIKIVSVKSSSLIPHCGRSRQPRASEFCRKLMKEYWAQVRGKEAAPEKEALAHVLLLERLLRHRFSPEKPSICPEKDSDDPVDDDNGDDDEPSGPPASFLCNEAIERQLREFTKDGAKDAVREIGSNDDGDDDDDDSSLSSCSLPEHQMHVPGEKSDIPLRPGDVITFLKPLAVAGRKDSRQTATVVSISPNDTTILGLDINVALPSDYEVCRLKTLEEGALRMVPTEHRFDIPIEDFVLEEGALEQNAGTKFSEEAVRVGEIVTRNMRKFQQEAQGNGFAPMDLMNRYKGTNFDSNVSEPASTELIRLSDRAAMDTGHK